MLLFCLLFIANLTGMTIRNLKGKIFVISLLRSKERRNHIKKELGEKKLNFEFFDAIDGSFLEMENDPRIDYEIVKRSPNWLTNNIVGCCLSHAYCYKKVIDENLDFAIILEDDVIIQHSNLENLISNILINSNSGTVTLLYYQSFEKITFRKSDGINVSSGVMAFNASGLNPISTGAYLIDRESCENMFNYTMPIHTGPDCWMEFHEKGAIKHLRLLYPIPITTMDFQSTVTNIEIQGKSKILKKIISWINSYKVPILYFLLQQRRNILKKKLQNITLTE